MDQAVEISIIIVHYRCWAVLERCLAKLAEDRDRAAAAMEIIVVDNDSGGGLLEDYRRRFPSVRFCVATGNYGFAHGCNLGAWLARAKVLVFLNPDVLAGSVEIERLVEEKARDPRVVVIGARQHDARGRAIKAFGCFPTLVRSFALARAFLPGPRATGQPEPRAGPGGLVYCDWVSGSVLLIDKRDLCRLGGWCEDFWMYLEDTDLCRRARLAGGEVACCTRLDLLHLHGGASRVSALATAITKTEVLISHHVYVERHHRGAYRVAFHLLLAAKQMGPLLGYALLDLATLHSAQALRIRASVCLRLAAYYRRLLASGRWLSPRSVNAAEQRCPSLASGR